MLQKVSPTDRHIIALDLDGTVLDHDFLGGDHPHDGRIDDELADAIRTLHESGHEVIISTGRSVDATLPIVERLRIKPEWVIAANGAVTLRRDAMGDRGYRREYVEAFDPTDALTRLRTRLTSARYAVELASGGFLYTEPIPAGTLPSKQRQVPFEELLGVQASRVVVVAPDHHFEDFVNLVETLGLSHVSYSVGTTSWLDIAPDGVSKASALEVLASRMNIDRANVFAAGDGRNDIEMLTWAAKSGDAVAMGQAEDVVKAVATRVTAPVAEDGLLIALRERFPALLG